MTFMAFMAATTLAIDVGPVRYKQVLKKLIAAEQAS